MQKLLLTAALLLGIASAASAQTNVVKVNILSPIVSTASFFFEHKVAEHRSLQLGALYTGWSSGNTRMNGFALTPEYRLYLSDDKPTLAGFYLGPFLRYQNLTLTMRSEYADADGNYGTQEGKAALNTFGGGVVAGYQCLFKQRFSLDAFLGPSFNGGSLRVTSGNDSQTFNPGPFTGFGVRSGLTFGIAF